MQVRYVYEALYVLAREATRLAFTLFYLRIFTLPGSRRVIFITLGLNVALGIAFFVAVMFKCTPVSYYWNQWDGQHVRAQESFPPSRRICLFPPLFFLRTVC